MGLPPVFFYSYGWKVLALSLYLIIGRCSSTDPLPTDPPSDPPSNPPPSGMLVITQHS